MRIFVEAVGISSGGGSVVLANLLQAIKAAQPANTLIVFGSNRTLRALEQDATDEVLDKIRFVQVAGKNSYVLRMLFQQLGMPIICWFWGADRIFAFGNTGSLVPTRPQFIYFHNALWLAPELYPKSNSWTRLRMSFHWWLIRKSMQRSKRVIVQTKALADMLYERVKLDALQIVTIPPGSSPTENLPPGEEQKIKNKIASHPLLLCVIHPAPHKNLEVMLRATALVCKLHPEVRLALTLDRNIRAQKALQIPEKLYQAQVAKFDIIIEELGIGDAIIWTGFLTPPEVQAWMKKCSVLCFPSLIESFGLPLVDALTAGIPIVAADRPYAREVCGDGALYADPFNPEEWSERIGTLLSDCERYTTVAAAGVEQGSLYSYRLAAERIVRMMSN